MFKSISRVDKKAKHATPPTHTALLSAAAAAARDRRGVGVYSRSQVRRPKEAITSK